MEVFMSEIAGLDHVSLGMRRPNGEYERPIPGRRLFWTKPGMTCAYVVRYISCHGREARVIQNRCGAIIKFFVNCFFNCDRDTQARINTRQSRNIYIRLCWFGIAHFG